MDWLVAFTIDRCLGHEFQLCVGDRQCAEAAQVTDMNAPYPFHRETMALVDAQPAALFALLDDHKRLAQHMEKPSLMMLGATMKIATDHQNGQAIGSLITVTGKMSSTGDYPETADSTVTGVAAGADLSINAEVSEPATRYFAGSAENLALQPALEK